MKTVFATAAITLFATFSVPGIAADDHSEHMHMQAQMTTQTPMQMVEGQVKKVDKTAGKVTLAHGPLVNLGMSAMTMEFSVKDTAWLNQIKEGDKIHFMADMVNGVITVVRIEKMAKATTP